MHPHAGEGIGVLECVNGWNQFSLSNEVGHWELLQFCYKVTTVVLAMGEGSCSWFLGWSLEVTQGTVNMWAQRVILLIYTQSALLIFVVGDSTFKRMARKTLFSQGLGRLSYSIVNHLKGVMKSTASLISTRKSKQSRFHRKSSFQVFTPDTHICNWQFPALSVPPAAENPTEHRNHKLDITAEPAPAHEQIANSSRNHIQCYLTDVSDFFRASNFTLLCTRV